MYCKECKVKIEGKATVCPLCHKPVKSSEDTPAFPAPTPRQMVVSRYYPIFFAVMVVLMIPAIVLNTLYYKQYPWSLIVFFLLLYVSFFIRHTVMTQAHFRERLIGQTIFLTIIAFVVRYTSGRFEWILSIALPALYIVSDMLLSFRMVQYQKYAAKNIMSVYVLGTLGLIPIITAFACGLSLKIPAMVASGMWIITIITVTIVFRRAIISEIKKFFHI